MRDERYGRIGNELSLLRARGSMYVCVDRIGLHRWNSAHYGTKLNSTHWRTNTDMIALQCRMRDERYGRLGNEFSCILA